MSQTPEPIPHEGDRNSDHLTVDGRGASAYVFGTRPDVEEGE